MCAQRRLRSAWASAQFDQSHRCPQEETLDPQLPFERTANILIRRVDAQFILLVCHEAAHWLLNASVQQLLL